MRRYTSRRKRALRNLAVATIILSIFFLVSKLFNGTRNSEDLVIAEFGKEKIYKSQVQNKLANIFSDEQQLVAIPQVENLPKEVIEIVIKEIIVDREILKQANKQGIHKDQKILDKINNYKEKIIRQAYLDAIIEKEVTKEKISQKYAELTNNLAGKKEYQIAHIVLKSKEEAEKILVEFKSKKAPKFSELAKKYSLEQQSGSNGGELGFVLEDNINKEIVDQLNNLKKEEVSQPIQTKLGWHIVKLIDYRDAKTSSFEELKDHIKDQLIQNKINEINSSFIKDNKINYLIDFEKIKQEKNKEVEIKEIKTEKSKTEENPSKEAEAINQDNKSVNNEEQKSSQESQANSTANDSNADQSTNNKSKSSNEKKEVNRKEDKNDGDKKTESNNKTDKELKNSKN